MSARRRGPARRRSSAMPQSAPRNEIDDLVASFLDRDGGAHDRAVLARDDLERAAELPQPALHAGDADAERVRLVRPVIRARDALPVILDLEHHRVAGAPEPHPGLAAAGMAMDVAEALLRDTEEGGLDVLRQSPAGFGGELG